MSWKREVFVFATDIGERLDAAKYADAIAQSPDATIDRITRQNLVEWANAKENNLSAYTNIKKLSEAGATPSLHALYLVLSDRVNEIYQSRKEAKAAAPPVEGESPISATAIIYLEGLLDQPSDVETLYHLGCSVDALFVLTAPDLPEAEPSAEGDDEEAEKTPPPPPPPRLFELFEKEAERCKSEAAWSQLRNIVIEQTENKGEAPEQLREMSCFVAQRAKDLFVKRREFAASILSEANYITAPKASDANVSRRYYDKLLSGIPEPAMSVPLVMFAMIEQVARDLDPSSESDLVAPVETPREDPAASLSSYLESAVSRLSVNPVRDPRRDLAARWSSNPQLNLLRYGDASAARGLEGGEMLHVPTASVEQNMLCRLPVFPPGTTDASSQFPSASLTVEQRGAKMTELFHFSGKGLSAQQVEREHLITAFEDLLTRSEQSHEWNLEDRTVFEEFSKSALLQVLIREGALLQPQVFTRFFDMQDSVLAAFVHQVPETRERAVSFGHKYPISPLLQDWLPEYEEEHPFNFVYVAPVPVDPKAKPGAKGAAATPAKPAAPAKGAAAPAAAAVVEEKQEEAQEEDSEPAPPRETIFVLDDVYPGLKQNGAILYPADGAFISLAVTETSTKTAAVAVHHNQAVFGCTVAPSAIPSVTFAATFDDGFSVSVSALTAKELDEAKAAASSPSMVSSQDQDQPEISESSDAAAAILVDASSADQAIVSPSAADVAPITPISVPTPRTRPVITISCANGLLIEHSGGDFIRQTPSRSSSSSSSSSPKSSSNALFSTAALFKSRPVLSSPGALSSVSTQDLVEFYDSTARKIVRVGVTEVSRGFLGKGTVVRAFADGRSQLFFADGNTSTGNLDGSWLIINSNGSRSASLADGSSVSLPALLSAQNMDPETRAIVRTREDLVMVVEYPDGSTLAQHTDGTRIWMEPSGRSRSECEGYAPVSSDQATRVSRIELPDRSSVECSFDNSVEIIRPDGAKISADVARSRVFFESSSRALDASDMRGLYIFDVANGGMSTIDPLGNRFIVSADGRYRVILSTDEDQLDDAFDFSVPIDHVPRDPSTVPEPAPGCSVMDSHPPRLFVIHKGGSGMELLRGRDVAAFIARAKEDSRSTTIFEEPVLGDSNAISMTFLTKFASNNASAPSSINRLIPKSVAPISGSSVFSSSSSSLSASSSLASAASPGKLGGSKSAASKTETLKFRQFVTYTPLSAAKRDAFRQGLQQWSEWSRKKEVYSASLSSQDNRSDEELQLEQDVQDKIAQMIANHRSELERAESAALQQHEKSFSEMEALETARSHKSQSAMQEPDQKKRKNPSSSTPSGAATPQKMDSARNPTYWQSPSSTFQSGAQQQDAYDPSDLRWTRRSGQAGAYLSDYRSQMDDMGHISHAEELHEAAIEAAIAAAGPGINLAAASASALLRTSPPRRPGGSPLSASGRLQKPSHQIASASSPSSLSQSLSSSAALAQRLDLYGKPRAPAALSPTLRNPPAPHEPNQRFEAIESPVRRHVNTTSVKLIKSRRGLNTQPMDTLQAYTHAQMFRGTSIGVDQRDPEIDAANFSAYPSQVQFGNVPPGRTYRASFTVCNLGTIPGRFLFKTAPNSILRVANRKGSVAPGMSVRAEVELSAVQEGEINEEIAVLAEQRIIHVLVTARITSEASADSLRRGVTIH